IKLMDSGTITDYRMVRYLKEIATKYQILWQPEILPAGGTDTAALQRFGKNGSIAGCISIPTRHIHTVVETIHKADIEAAIQLLVRCTEELDQFNHQW
ncbi:MAG: M42 family peptidase, partial [Bacteroidia bacterium]|nr:M42 family peptidase [Bacteroidia bacterium]